MNIRQSSLSKSQCTRLASSGLERITERYRRKRGNLGAFRDVIAGIGHTTRKHRFFTSRFEAVLAAQLNGQLLIGAGDGGWKNGQGTNWSLYGAKLKEKRDKRKPITNNSKSFLWLIFDRPVFVVTDLSKKLFHPITLLLHEFSRFSIILLYLEIIWLIW